MAITLKELREKEFTRQVRGYSMDEVQDYLDDIADQMEELIREHRAMSQKLAEFENAAPIAEAPMAEAAAPAPVMEAAPAKDDSAYFRNLETTLRDTLVSAQRVAEDTVNEAQKKAETTVAEAQEKAETTVAAAQEKAQSLVADAEAQVSSMLEKAQTEVANLQAEAQQLRESANAYREGFMSLVKDQMEILKADESLF